MAQFSFDIVSDYDIAELNNVFDQTKREMTGRYDFKNTAAELNWLDTTKSGLRLQADSEWQLDAIIDIFRKKLAARNQSQKILDVTQDPITSNMRVQKDIPFIKGLDQAKAKKITAIIREHSPKAKALIQGDIVRVTSSSKDELQAIMQTLSAADFDFPLHYTNYR